MGEGAARSLTLRRSRVRAYLRLARFSNLPTVWTNVLAGTIVARSAFVKADVMRVALSVSLLYTAGMFLNDGFDRDFDARSRPDRPIPAGDVSAIEAFRAGWLLLALGLLVVAVERNLPAFAWASLLSGAIVFYDYRHKQNPFGPLIMGACRGLVYCVAASAASKVTLPVVAAAVALTLYVVGITVVAKRAGSRASWLVPLLIAGISVVDGIVIGLSGGGPLAWIVLVGFPATLLLQRVVPGT